MLKKDKVHTQRNSPYMTTVGEMLLNSRQKQKQKQKTQSLS